MNNRRDGWFEAGFEVFLGWACAGCHRPGARLCADCRRLLHRTAYPVFRAGCRRPIFAGSRFEGSTRQLITALKERDAWQLARPLGEQLGVAVAASLLGVSGAGRAGWGGALLVPVPSSRQAVRARGLDVTAVLAKKAAASLHREGVRARVSRPLRQRPGVQDQSGLSASGRRENMVGAIVASRSGVRELKRATDREANTVVLVDDIVTTGSTLASAAHALAEQDISVDGFAVIAEKP